MKPAIQNQLCRHQARVLSWKKLTDRENSPKLLLPCPNALMTWMPPPYSTRAAFISLPERR